ncbi:MAG: PKD domain-containing protein, partial [Planctomycetota bacterium]
MKGKKALLVIIISLFSIQHVYGWENSPVAVQKANPKYVLINEEIVFDGSPSYDVDSSSGINGIKKFAWDFNYDGETFHQDYAESSTSPGDGFDGITTHEYGTAREYTVALKVTDYDPTPNTTIVETKVFVYEDVDSKVIYVKDSSGITLPLNNTISWWKFDEVDGITAFDSAGNNNGTLQGDPDRTDGRINGALKFDGIEDYVSIPYDSSLELDYLTLS